MKRLYLILLLAIALVPSYAQYRSGYQDLYDSETVSRLKEHVSYLASSMTEGRKAGSEGEAIAARYVSETLESYGVDLLSGRDGDVFGMLQPQGDTLRSRNVIGFVQGCDPQLRDRYIVVGARLDNLGTHSLSIDGVETTQIFSGANGNASGLAMMMELASMVSTNSILFRRSVLFVAFGASRQSLAGSWYFLNRSFKDADRIDAMINLDMLGSYEGFSAFTASNRDLDMLLSSMSSQLLPLTPKTVTSDAYQSDHRSFYAAGIPSVFFSTGEYPEHDTPRDTPDMLAYDMMEKELEYIYAFTRTIANEKVAPSFLGKPQEKASDDRAYSFHDCDEKPVFMGHADPSWFMTKWVYQYLRYPQEAVSAGIQGRVNVTFTIGKDGRVEEVRVDKGVDELLDAEAVRVIKASPKWKAAKKDGKTVRCYITVPVDFRLEKKGRRSK